MQPRNRATWLGLIAGLVALAMFAHAHEMLAAFHQLRSPAPLPSSGKEFGTPFWLLLQFVDLIGAVMAGVAAAHWSPRLSWEAPLTLLAAASLYIFFAQLPTTNLSALLLIWVGATPSGLLAGAWVYRYRERSRPEASAQPVPPDHPKPPHTAWPEAVTVVAICFGYFILASFLAVSNGFNERPFSDNVFAGMVVLELILAAIAVTVLHARHYPLRTLLPKPSWGGVGTAVLLYLGINAVSQGVANVFSTQAAQPVEQMLRASHVSLLALLPLALVNGIYEEVFLLAYLQRGLRRFGGSNAIGVAVLVRTLYHLYQGLVGAATVAVYGLVVGLYYWRSGRLFPAIALHIAADIIPFL